jgi:hypothetical protein
MRAASERFSAEVQTQRPRKLSRVIDKDDSSFALINLNSKPEANTIQVKKSDICIMVIYSPVVFSLFSTVSFQFRVAHFCSHRVQALSSPSFFWPHHEATQQQIDHGALVSLVCTTLLLRSRPSLLATNTVQVDRRRLQRVYATALPCLQSKYHGF